MKMWVLLLRLRFVANINSHSDKSIIINHSETKNPLVQDLRNLISIQHQIHIERLYPHFKLIRLT